MLVDWVQFNIKMESNFDTKKCGGSVEFSEKSIIIGYFIYDVWGKSRVIWLIWYVILTLRVKTQLIGAI